MLKLKTLALASMLFAGAAVASPNVILSSGSSAEVGFSAPVTMTFEGNGIVAGFDFEFGFDSLALTVDSVNCAATVPTSGADATVACSVVGDSIKVLISPPFTFPIPTIINGPVALGSVTFLSDLDTTPGFYAMPILDENYFDAAANAVVGTGSTDGGITIVAAPPPILYGDANNDGIINQEDIPYILDEYFEVAQAPGPADCNQDGSVNSGDVICVINKALGG